jgi:uncharacterized protein YqjF (DUF2071 family)
MRWRELLFIHWPVPAASLRPLIPRGLALDTFDGSAWLGVVPFRMTASRVRGLPPVPGLSEFPELNVRTYVTTEGKPGVWFFGLDAASWLAVRGARWLFHLPYFDARMVVGRRGDQIDYRSGRTHRRAPPAQFAARYRPTGPTKPAAPGTLEYFLTERYCLYAADRQQRVYRGDIAHAPWPLQSAEIDLSLNRMTGQIGVTLPDVPPLLHYAERLDVVAWMIESVKS